MLLAYSHIPFGAKEVSAIDCCARRLVCEKRSRDEAQESGKDSLEHEEEEADDIGAATR